MPELGTVIQVVHRLMRVPRWYLVMVVHDKPATRSILSRPVKLRTMAAIRLPVRMTPESTQCSIPCCFLVTVGGATNGDLFRGVLLVAKRSSDNQVVGTWSTTDSNFQTVDCDGVPNTGITHQSKTDKAQVSAIWTAPAGVAQGDIIIRYATLPSVTHFVVNGLFRATVVKTFNTYYVDCFRTTLTAAQVCALTVVVRWNTSIDYLCRSLRRPMERT